MNTLRWTIAFAIAALSWTLAVVAQNGGNTPQELAGTVDIHVHSDPDSRPRSIDAIDVARLAESKGMRAIVLKNHDDPTGPLAYIVRKQVPGIEVFGGIALNLTVGGINPAAVQHMTEVSGGWGRFVWMPTFDAENHVRSAKENRPFVSVSRNGELLPEVKQVIGLIAKHGLVLATGHSTPAEALMLLREGKRQNVQHMVVTHATFTPVFMNVDQMRQAAREGAFIEFAGGSVTGAGAAARINGFAEAIRTVGHEFCILSTDLGQRGNAFPPDGLAAFLQAMRDRGFTPQEIDRMARQNPARLLGLP